MTPRLSTLRDAIAAHLAALEYFEGIPVFTEKKGDVANEIQRALSTLTPTGSKIGACVIIVTPLAAISQPNIPGPYLDPITLIAHVEESVIINHGDTGTLKPASDIAEAILSALHRTTLAGFARPLIADRNAIAAAEPIVGDVAYDVRFSTAAGIVP